MAQSVLDDSLAQVTFRLCRFMLARKVLWDEDGGFAVAELARALTLPETIVEEVAASLNREGWIARGDGDDRLTLTERGVSEILGRRVEAPRPPDLHRSLGVTGNGGLPDGAIGAVASAAEELLRG